MLSKAVLYIALPCTLVNAFQTDYDPNILGAFLVTLAIAVLIHGIFWLVCWLLDRTGSQLTPAEKAPVIYSNAGNLIIPIVLNTLGQEYVIYTCSYMGLSGILSLDPWAEAYGGRRPAHPEKSGEKPLPLCHTDGHGTVFLTYPSA